MYKDIKLKVAKELNLPVEVVDLAYDSFYKFIRETIASLPLKEDLSEEEFKSLKTNFNIPSIGKLHCTYDRFLRMKETLKYIKTVKNYDKDKED